MKIIRVSAMWCMSCLVMQKVWNKVFSEYENLEIIDYDYDEDYEHIKDLNIGDVLPVLIFSSDDQELKRVIGEKSYKEMKKVMEEINDEKT